MAGRVDRFDQGAPIQAAWIWWRLASALLALVPVVAALVLEFSPSHAIRDLGAGGGSRPEAVRPVAFAAPLARGAVGGRYSINFKLSGAYVGSICLRSDTTIRTHDSQSYCSGWKGAGANWTLSVPFTDGDTIYVDAKVRAGPSKQDIVVTAANWCALSGTVQSVKFNCDVPLGGASAQAMPPPSVEPFNPDSVLGPDAQGKSGTPVERNLLGLLAWCVSAAGVAGLIIIGMQLGLQLRSGVPGAGSMIWQEFIIVIVACILAVTAGPIVGFLNLTLF
ncbi:hypothetical protein ACIA5C_44925 [Actinoplanes sp. NPDC051343]|uniref:hypothetical protein n=1 Tax=Actinoplanes sp. NPDC051343 TaxID=3363906 RepID=UPI0037B65474